MRRELGILAGVTAVAAVVVATQTGFSERPAPPEAASVPAVGEPPAAMVALDPPAPAEPLEPEPDPEAEARVAALAAEIERHEVELAELQATLAERDAALAARDAEIERLRGELRALRERFAFELRLAATKALDAERVAADAEAAPSADPRTELVAASAPAAAREAPMTAIHFEVGSARLTPGGQAHCAAAAVLLAEMPLDRIRVSGFADRTGAPARNQALADARARAVADFLVAAGLPADRIETVGTITAEMLPVATDAGVSEPLNRAATITAVPPPTT